MNQSENDFIDNWVLLRDAIIMRAIMDLQAFSKEVWDYAEISWDLRTGEMDWLFEGFPYGGAVLYKKLKRYPVMSKRQISAILKSLMGDE